MSSHYRGGLVRHSEPCRQNGPVRLKKKEKKAAFAALYGRRGAQWLFLPMMQRAALTSSAAEVATMMMTMAVVMNIFHVFISLLNSKTWRRLAATGEAVGGETCRSPLDFQYLLCPPGGARDIGELALLAATAKRGKGRRSDKDGEQGRMLLSDTHLGNIT